jgi:hypothetical protein
MYKHGEKIDHQEVQEILQAYLLTHQNTAAVPSVLVPNLFKLTPTSSVEEIKEQLTSVIQKRPPDKRKSLTRVVLNIPLNDHFGFAVLDLKNLQLVIDEPLGNRGYDKQLDNYIEAIKELTKASNIKLKVLRFTRLQTGDTFNCGRISAKVLAYLATTKECLEKAIGNKEEIKKLTVNSKEKSQDLCKEQQALLTLQKTQDLKTLYKNFLKNAIKLTEGELASLDDHFYQEMHDGFTIAGWYPCLLPKPEEACTKADPQTLRAFKEIIQRYIKVKKEANKNQKDILCNQFYGYLKEAGLIDATRIIDEVGRDSDQLDASHVDLVFSHACNKAIYFLASNSNEQYFNSLNKPPQPSNKTPTPKQPDKLSPANASIKADDPWQKIKAAEFVAHYKKKGFNVIHSPDGREVNISEPNHTGGVSKQVTLRRNTQNQVEVEAENPDQKTMQVMADSLSQGLKPPRNKVTIHVTGPNMQDPIVKHKAQQMQDDLWLAAMSSGLWVDNYTPLDKKICEEGRQKYAHFTKNNTHTEAPTHSFG